MSLQKSIEILQTIICLNQCQLAAILATLSIFLQLIERTIQISLEKFSFHTLATIEEDNSKINSCGFLGSSYSKRVDLLISPLGWIQNAQKNSMLA